MSLICRFIAVVLVSALLLGQLAHAGGVRELRLAEETLDRITNARPSSEADRSLEALLERAHIAGELKIVISLALPQPFRAEGSLSRSAIDVQRNYIAQAQDEIDALLAGRGAQVYGRYETIPAMAVTVDADTLGRLGASPWVVHIQEDVAVPPTLASSTPVIGAPAVWAQGLDGSGQAVVILDTGIDGAHSFYEAANGDSRIVAEACFSNAAGAGGRVSLCPGGGSSQTGTGAAEASTGACVNGGSNLCHHGPHVAGIAAGQGGSFHGVARNAGIIPIQVFTRFNAGSDCSPNPAPCVMSFTSDQLAALNHVFNVLHPAHSIASVNMSLGGGSNTSHCDSDARKAPIDNLRSVGIATVIATGNNGFTNAISTPACISTAVAVSSTTDADLVSGFSNVHAMMHLFAPGSAIDSSIVGGGFANFNGTSMAAPHVAGAWAVLKQASPTATVTEILDALTSTGVAVSDQRSGGTVTRPRIQLDAAAANLAPNTWLGTISSNWHTPGNWSAGAVPNCGSSAVIAASASNFPVLGADASVRGLSIENGASFSMSAHTLSVCGNLEVADGGVFAMSGGTLLFDGTSVASVSLPLGSRQLHHLQIGNGSDSKSLTLANPLLIAGDLTISEQAILDSNGFGLAFNGATQALNVLGAGGSQTAYSNDLSSLAGWSVNDANSDGVTWFATSTTNAPNSPNSGQHARYAYNTDATTAANDWLFSPGVVLQAGTTYTVKFNYGARSATWPERLGVYIGTSNAVPAMTTQLFNNSNVVNMSWAQGSGSFTPSVSGTYHVGFHAHSEADQWELAVDDLLIEFDAGASLHGIEVASGSTLELNSVMELSIDNDLVINGSLDLNGSDIRVDGSVINSGTLRDTREVPNTLSTSILHIRTVDGSATRYRGVEITPSSGAMGATTVAISGNSDCTSNSADPLFQRCFDVAPAMAQTAALRLWLTEAERNAQDASAATLMRWNGMAWVGASSTDSYTRSAGGAACNSDDGTLCWVQANVVTSYSPFVVGASATGVPVGVQTHTVTPSAGAGGSISPSTPQTIIEGQSAVFTLNPAEGFAIDEVTGSCGGSLVGNTYTTNPVTANCTVVASFEALTYTVTPSAGTGGSISPSTPQTITHGQTIAFTLNPAVGFAIDEVSGSCGGNLVGNTFTTNPVTTNCTVVASFEALTYTVTPSAGTGGSISPSTAQTVTHGQTIAFTLNPNAGFAIDEVTGSCGGNLVGNTFTTSPVTANCTVVASFEALTYTVTPSAGTGGSISPNTAQTVTHGQSIAFTLNPAAGFAIDEVTGSCGGNLVGNTYTTNPVTANCTVVASFEALSYTVTPSAGTGGSISPSTAQTVTHGQSIAFTLNPAVGFAIDEVSGSCGGNLVGDTFTTDPVTANCTVVASFEALSYTVTPSAGTGGSISPSTAQTVTHGQTIAFTLNPSAGFAIDEVSGSCGGNLVGDTFTTNPVTANCTVVASFEALTYTVTPSAGTGGNISPNTAQTVTHGQTIDFTLTPSAGFAIDEVSGSCGGNLVDNTYTTNPVTANCTVVASFEALSYTVTPSAGTGGSISPSTPQTVTHGQSIAFTLNPAVGFAIDEVTGSCGGNLVGNTFTTSPVTANCTVVASFEALTYTVTPSAGTGGSISPSTAQTVTHGQTIAFTLNPSAGFAIDEVTGSCDGNLVGNTYTTNPVTANCTVVASFEALTYTVTPSAGTGGSISPSTAQTVTHGQSIAFTLNPSAGFAIDEVTGSCGGNLVGNTYTTDPVTANCTVVASFEALTYTVTPSAGAGGSISPNTAQTVTHGQTIAFTLNPAVGFAIDEVSGSCGGNLVGNTFTTSPVTANCTVVASFEALTYTVTPSAGTGGSISPSTPQTVTHGQSIAFTLNPSAGFAIDEVTGSCGGNLVGNTYTTNPVTANCTVVASFEALSYTVTPSAGTGGSISPSTAQTVTHGQSIAFTLNPAVGFAIDEVTGSCGGNLVGNTYTTDPVTANCTVVASFEALTYTVTPSAGAGGSISPNTAQTVTHGQTIDFTLNTNEGFAIDEVTGSCGGNLVGNTFTTSPVTANCTVVADFMALEVTSTVLGAVASPVPLGTNVDLVVTVSGTASAPADGLVEISANTGESCSDAGPPQTAGSVASFGCAVVFATPGPRVLSASFSASQTHLDSTSVAQALDVVRIADLSVSIDVSQGDIAPGHPIVFVIEFLNAGPDAAPGSSLSVVSDPSLVDASWTCASIGSALCAASDGSGDIATLENLPAGSGLEFTLIADIPELPEGSLMLEAEVSADSAAPHYVVDNEPANNSATLMLQESPIFANGFEQLTD